MLFPGWDDSAKKPTPTRVRSSSSTKRSGAHASITLPILLSALSPGDEGWKPTDAEVQRAHEMLAGSWQFLSINDKGEILGPRLVESRFARDGILTIADRLMTIVNPVTGENRTATYRIDPSKSPRRIDLIMRDDRLLRGIYKFEGDNLTLCLQPDEARQRTGGFFVDRKART